MRDGFAALHICAFPFLFKSTEQAGFQVLKAFNLISPADERNQLEYARDKYGAILRSTAHLQQRSSVNAALG